MSTLTLLYNFQTTFQNSKANPYKLFGKHHGEWLGYTISNIRKKSQVMAKTLENHVVKKGKCVAVITNNYPD